MLVGERVQLGNPLVQMDRHSSELEEMDVEGILAFAERVLPRAADLWVQASLNQKQRLQQLFFPDGISFDGKRFVRTAVTTHAFNYLTCADGSENQVASPSTPSWNQILTFLREMQLDQSSLQLQVLLETFQPEPLPR